MQPKDFTIWLGQFENELKVARKNYKARVLEILKRHATSLASLSEGQLREVIEIVKTQHFCLEGDVRKAVAFGKRTIPEPIYDTKAITLETWERLPEEAKVTLSNPTNTVMVKRGGSREPLTVAKLPKVSERVVRKIISGNKPELGIIDPDQYVDRSVKPEYMKLVDARLDPDDESMAILTSRMSTGKVLYKTRISVVDLERVISSIMEKNPWTCV